MREIERGQEKSKEQIENEIKSKLIKIYKWSFPQRPEIAFAIVSLDGNFYTANVNFEENDRMIDIKPGNIQELSANAYDPLLRKFSTIPVITDHEGGKLLNRSSIVVGRDEHTEFQTRIFKKHVRAGNFKHYTYPGKF